MAIIGTVAFPPQKRIGAKRSWAFRRDHQVPHQPPPHVLINHPSSHQIATLYHTPDEDLERSFATQRDGSDLRFTDHRQVIKGSPREVQTKSDAVWFLQEVKCTFRDDKEKYAEFLHLMKTFGEDRIGKDEVISRAKMTFDGHPKLVLGFSAREDSHG